VPSADFLDDLPDPPVAEADPPAASVAPADPADAPADSGSLGIGSLKRSNKP